ncbi:serine/threonine-protein kinase [Serinicoccus kebangsaanensis]|uniref:serine/threonine-protein kinase n=1 Tax=Serinicoccus kebangsaanensis TaxID=2602069 RepID=UPI00124E340E|nr:serine/threonine-protein kinase [Serinicoccus kebangsaanensis]
MTVPTVPGYDVLGPLGAGGSGSVWRGRRRVDDLPVAIKLVRPGDGRGDLTAALAEAGLMAGLRHEHILHLYDVLPLGEAEHPTVALVTQLAAGGSLAQVLHRRRLLSPGELVTVLHPLARALAELHRLGVVHGDVSAGNVLFRSDGMPLLGDLGTARVVGEHGLQGWGTGGHDGMVAPEVMEGFSATVESDVYQVGALAWLCLVGQTPGPGFDRPALAEVDPNLPGDLVDLVQRCMGPQPEDRPAAEELPAALLALADPEPIEVAPEADVAHGLTERLRQVALADASGPTSPRRRRWGVGRRSAPTREQDTTARPAVLRRGGAHRVASATGGSRRWHGWWVAAGVAVALLLVVATVRLWLPQPPAAGPPAALPSATPTTPVESPPTGAGSGHAPAPAATATATPSPADWDEHETVVVLQRLLDGRSAAWERSDPARVDEVMAPGSPAHRAELADLAEAGAAGVSYPSVVFTVTEARVGQVDRGSATVDLTVRRAALQVRRGDEVVRAEPEREDRIRVVLTRHDQRWLVHEWGPQPTR